MKRKRLVAVFVLVGVLGGAGTSSADWVTEIINSALLRQINIVLDRMILYQQKLTNIANVYVYNRYRFFAFTEGIFNPMTRSIAQVGDIRNEVKQIACGWQFSPRTAILRALYIEPVRLCRPSFHAIWGSHTAAVDRDVHELNDYVAVMTANQLATLSQSQQSWAHVFPDTFSRANVAGFSPGEANRYEAAMLAQAGQVALSNNQIHSQALLVAEMERALERREERHLVNFSVYTMQGLATLNGGARR